VLLATASDGLAKAAYALHLATEPTHKADGREIMREFYASPDDDITESEDEDDDEDDDDDDEEEEAEEDGKACTFNEELQLAADAATA
jgi:hypothetical protein